MDHPATPESVDAPASYDEASAAAALAASFSEELKEEENPQPEGEPELDDLDDPEGEGAADEQGEPEEPAITPPVSLNAEEKARFAQLPPEAQKLILDVEGRRNSDVTRVTQQAAAKEREAQKALERADAEAAVHYAAQLKVFADTFRPQMPDPQLAQYDPQRYIAEKAQYDADIAQFDILEQQIAAVRDEATGKVAEIDQRTRVADLMTVPELANPETRDSHVQWARGLVTELGIDPDMFEQNADSGDFKSLKTVAAWRDKAAKYDAAMQRKMQRVRDGKSRTMRPNAAQPESSGRNRAFNEASGRLRSTGSVDDAAAAIRLMLS